MKSDVIKVIIDKALKDSSNKSSPTVVALNLSTTSFGTFPGVSSIQHIGTIKSSLSSGKSAFLIGKLIWKRVVAFIGKPNLTFKSTNVSCRSFCGFNPSYGSNSVGSPL